MLKFEKFAIWRAWFSRTWVYRISWYLTFHWLKACHVMSFHSCIQLDSISWNKLQIVTCCILVCRRPGSDFKRREMHGSGIFNGTGSGQSDGNGAHADRTTVRMHQVIIALCMSPSLVIKIYLVLKCKGHHCILQHHLHHSSKTWFENCSVTLLVFWLPLFSSFMSLYMFQVIINIGLNVQLIWTTEEWYLISVNIYRSARFCYRLYLNDDNNWWTWGSGDVAELQQLQQPRGRTQSNAKHKELNGSNVFPVGLKFTCSILNFYSWHVAEQFIIDLLNARIQLPTV